MKCLVTTAKCSGTAADIVQEDSRYAPVLAHRLSKCAIPRELTYESRQDHCCVLSNSDAGHYSSPNIVWVSSRKKNILATCALLFLLAPVQVDIDRAVALLHSFQYGLAEKTFLHVTETDPQCAIAIGERPDSLSPALGFGNARP